MLVNQGKARLGTVHPNDHNHRPTRLTNPENKF